MTARTQKKRGRLPALFGTGIETPTPRAINRPSSPEPLRVPFLRLRFGRCKWIVDVAVPACCGHEVESGKPYCPAHCAIAYRRPPAGGAA